jgi:tripartite-type tricarboxylate transporter receptor subunit TctC
VQFKRNDKLRALAVTGASRFFALPNVPTMIEAGFPGYVVTGYHGIIAPAGLPGATTEKINRAITAVLSEPNIVEKLKNIGTLQNHRVPKNSRRALLPISRSGKA